MLEIKVLGPGCANCRKLEALVHEALAMTGLEARVVKVTDLNEILAHEVLKTPGLVIAGKLVCSGRIPTTASIAEWIRAA